MYQAVRILAQGRNNPAVNVYRAAEAGLISSVLAADSGRALCPGRCYARRCKRACALALAVDIERIVLCHADAGARCEGAAVREDEIGLAADLDALGNFNVADDHISARPRSAVLVIAVYYRILVVAQKRFFAHEVAAAALGIRILVLYVADIVRKSAHAQQHRADRERYRRYPSPASHTKSSYQGLSLRCAGARRACPSGLFYQLLAPAWLRVRGKMMRVR